MNPHHNPPPQNAPSTVRVPAVPLSVAAKNSLKTAILTSNAGTGEPTAEALAQCHHHGLPRALVLRSVSAFHAKKREYINALVNMGKATVNTTTLPMPMVQHLVDGIVHAVATATASAQAAVQKAKVVPKPTTSVSAMAGTVAGAPVVPNPLGVPGMPPNKLVTPSHMKPTGQVPGVRPVPVPAPSMVAPPLKVTTQAPVSNLSLQQSLLDSSNTMAAMSTLLQSPPTSSYQAKAAPPAATPIKLPTVAKATQVVPAPAPVSAADLWRKKMTQEFLTTWEWSKPQSGLFLKTHDGKFIVAPKSLGAVRGRSPPFVPESKVIDIDKPLDLQPYNDQSKENLLLLQEARAIQERLRRLRSAAKVPLGPSGGLRETFQLLVDPMSYRRFKLEPKKEAKQVERTLKKSRGNAADTLIKTHKDFLKAIVSHQR